MANDKQSAKLGEGSGECESHHGRGSHASDVRIVLRIPHGARCIIGFARAVGGVAVGVGTIALYCGAVGPVDMPRQVDHLLFFTTALVISLTWPRRETRNVDSFFLRSLIPLDRRACIEDIEITVRIETVKHIIANIRTPC